ncbi:MAG: hypothetical protein O7E54_10340 [Planctomycetota bacterium]|nr:hypothetical protein [Planctomycetota bacterium]
MRRALPAILFAFAFAFAYYTRVWIALSFSNPEGIIGHLPNLGYHPANDTLRFAWIVLLPAVAMLAARRWLPPAPAAQPAAADRNNRRSILFLSVAVLVFICGTFNYDRFPYRLQGGVGGVPLDTYHEGEALGAAVQWESGQLPYRDTVFYHGAGEDPGLALVAFGLFGRSVASLRILIAWLYVVVAILFFFVVRRLFPDRPRAFLLALSLLWLAWSVRPSHLGFILEIRDAFTLAFILVVTKLRRWSEEDRPRKGYVLFFLAAAIAATAWAYSVDRGIYLTIVSLPVLGAAAVVWARAPRWPYVVSALVGYALGFLILGVAIRWQYAAMFHYLFHDLIPYRGFLFNRLYDFGSYIFLAPVLLIAANISWCVRRYTASDSLRPFLRDYGLEVALALLSLVFYLGALGDSDLHHVWYSAMPAYLLGVRIVVRHLLGRARPRVVGVLAVAALALFLGRHIRRIPSDWGRLPAQVADEELEVLAYPDSGAFWDAVRYLRERVPPGASFYTIASESIWFYLLDRPCPTRFPLFHLALAPHLQREVIADLEAKSVPYLLYRTPHWTRNKTYPQRFPIVFEYIHAHYEPLKTFGGIEIWHRVD